MLWKNELFPVYYFNQYQIYFSFFTGKQQPSPEVEPLEIPDDEDMAVDEDDDKGSEGEDEKENPFDIDVMKSVFFFSKIFRTY